MKEAINPMKKLCGAKARTNENKPCRKLAMANGRCRLHGGLSTGPKTEEGKRNIARARTTTGLRTKEMLAERQRCGELKSNAEDAMESVQRRIDLWKRMEAGDEYAFDFLELGEEHSEYELEQAILKNIEKFLREMGNVYAFMGSQYRLEVGDQEYFIDLLLFHRKLKSLVAIDLKIGPFIPEYVGKMQFYLAVLNDTVRMEDENPSIGIILCKEKNRTIVEYSLKETNKPINVAAYKTTTSLPKELRDELPSPDQIARLLDYLNPS